MLGRPSACPLPAPIVLIPRLPSNACADQLPTSPKPLALPRRLFRAKNGLHHSRFIGLGSRFCAPQGSTLYIIPAHVHMPPPYRSPANICPTARSAPPDKGSPSASSSRPEPRQTIHGTRAPVMPSKYQGAPRLSSHMLERLHPGAQFNSWLLRCGTLLPRTPSGPGTQRAQAPSALLRLGSRPLRALRSVTGRVTNRLGRAPKFNLARQKASA